MKRRIELPAKFIAHYLRLANQFNPHRARKTLLDGWRMALAGMDTVPGYDSAPPETSSGYPAGWSYGKLRSYLPKPHTNLTLPI